MKNCYFYWFSLINCATNSVSLHTIYASTELLPKALKCSIVSTFFRHCFHYSSLPRSALLHVQCLPLSFIPAPLIFVSSFVDSPQWQMCRVSILRMSLRLRVRKGERRQSSLFDLPFVSSYFGTAPLCSIEWIIIDGTTSLGCRQQAQGADKAGKKPQTQLFYATCHFWQPTCEESTKRKRRGNKPKKNCRQIFL